jgi:hypothetical protein
MLARAALIAARRGGATAAAAAAVTTSASGAGRFYFSAASARHVAIPIATGVRGFSASASAGSTSGEDAAPLPPPVFVVFGATGGIGEAVARKLHATHAGREEGGGFARFYTHTHFARRTLTARSQLYSPRSTHVQSKLS